MASVQQMLLSTLHPLLRSYVRYGPANLGKPALTQKLVTLFRASPRTKIVRRVQGLKFHTETDDLLQGYLYLFGVWEPNLTDWIRRTLRPGDTFVDVGANIGYFTILASRLVGAEGRVVAIEASPAFSQEIRRNVALNECANVRLLNAAVSDGAGRLDFYQPISWNRGNTTSVLPGTSAGTAVVPRFGIECEALPDLLTNEELRQARLVKIDVEGLELATIRGLLPVLTKLRPDAELVLEISPELLETQGESAAGLVDLLAAHGFHAYRIPNGYCISDYLPRRPPELPRRWTAPVTGLSDYVFSRRDVEAL